jgi:hypothetical protein
MKIGRTIAWATAAALVMPAFLAAQSLGDAAAKEKEKKKDAKAKVYTEDDLKRAGSSGTYSAPTGPDATADAQPKAEGAAKDAKPGDPKAKTDDEIRAEKQADWHKRLEKAQQDQATIQKAIDDIQASLGQNQSYYTPSRAKAVSDLDEAKAKLEKAQQAVTDLEEEGRRNGFH